MTPSSSIQQRTACLKACVLSCTLNPAGTILPQEKITAQFYEALKKKTLTSGLFNVLGSNNPIIR